MRTCIDVSPEYNYMNMNNQNNDKINDQVASLEGSGNNFTNSNYHTAQMSSLERPQSKQHYMSGMIQAQQNELENQNYMRARSPSEGGMQQNVMNMQPNMMQNQAVGKWIIVDFSGLILWYGLEEESNDEMLEQLEQLAKENKALKEANRRHMPYNMQLCLLKSEESEEFYRTKMYSKEKEIDHFKRQCHLLEKRCEESYDIQHDMENALEEYEVNTKKWEEQLKTTSRKFQDLQRKYSTLTEEKRVMGDKMVKLEDDKTKLSEKWIKLSAKNKHDDKIRQRLKELEQTHDKKTREMSSLTEKLSKIERENTMLRKANDSLQNTVNQQVKKIKGLKSTTVEKNDEQEITDQITSELLDKINQYEEVLQETKLENEQLTGRFITPF